MDDIYVEEEIVKSSDEGMMDVEIDSKNDLSNSLPSFTSACDPLAPNADGSPAADDGGDFEDEDSKVNIDRLKEELEESLNNQEERDPSAESNSKVKDKKKEKSKKELEEEEREKMQVLVSNFTEDQLNHYEMFRRAAFPKAAIKRVAPEYVTMGVLFAEPTQDVTLARLKALADEFLPNGWKTWRIAGDCPEIELEPREMNLLQFALPTESIARAFDPATVSVKVDDYSDMKKKMLSWHFCRGLVVHPYSLSVEIRGSQEEHDRFIAAIDCVQVRAIGIEPANLVLKPSESSNEIVLLREVEGASGPAAETAGTSNTEEESSDEDEEAGDVRERLDVLEARMAKLEDKQSEVLDRLRKGNFTHLAELVASSSTAEASPPSAASQEKTNSPPEPQRSSYDSFFEPMTVADPEIPEPSPEIQAAGIRCQKLNSPAWNNIAFEEAKRRLEAGGMFKALQVNPELNYVEDAYSLHLEEMDSMLGLLTNGLLLQRQALSKAVKKLTRRHPEAGRTLDRLLASENSPFREVSDDLLQYVCAKRSEIIMCRRKLLESSVRVDPEVLQKIPPSDEYLFEPRQLAEVLHQYELDNIDSAPPARFEKRPSQTFRRAAKRMKRSRGASGRSGDRR